METGRYQRSDSEDCEVYLEFLENAVFNIYELSPYRHFSGRYQVKQDIFTGIYDDGGRSKEYEVSFDNSFLVLTYVKDDMKEVDVYQKTVIPDEVRNRACSKSASVLPDNGRRPL